MSAQSYYLNVYCYCPTEGCASGCGRGAANCLTESDAVACYWDPMMESWRMVVSTPYGTFEECDGNLPSATC